MNDKSNPFLKSQQEIDFDLESKLKVINSDLGNNQLKEYQFKNNEVEVFLTDENDNFYSDTPDERESVFPQKKK